MSELSSLLAEELVAHIVPPEHETLKGGDVDSSREMVGGWGREYDRARLGSEMAQAGRGRMAAPPSQGAKTIEFHQESQSGLAIAPRRPYHANWRTYNPSAGTFPVRLQEAGFSWIVITSPQIPDAHTPVREPGPRETTI